MAYTALLGNLDLIPSTYSACNSNTKGFNASGLHGHLYLYAHPTPTHMHITKSKKSINIGNPAIDTKVTSAPHGQEWGAPVCTEPWHGKRGALWGSLQRLQGDKKRRFACVQEHSLEEREAGSAEGFEQTETQSRTADLGQVTVLSTDDRG